MTSTPATVALDAAGIRYVGHRYEHDPAVGDYGAEAAEALGVDAARVFKTLVVSVGSGLAVGVVPVSGSLDLKALASALGAPKAVMADPAVAERRTGSVRGGISPIGLRTRLRTVLDDTAAGFPTVFVSGGRRGFDVELAPGDLVAVTGALVAAISRGRPGLSPRSR